MFVSSLLTARRPLTPVSPSFDYLRRSLDELLNDTAPAIASHAGQMRLDVHEAKDALYVTADLPGVDEKDLDITFDEGVLTIAGERKIERQEESETWHVIERASGRFERHLSLAANIEADKIAASFDKGVLKITLPKREVAPKTAKKIAITTAA